MYLGGAQGPTVLGTINVMCAAALAEGETVLVGAACEPEVVGLRRPAEQDGREDHRPRHAGDPIEGVDKLDRLPSTASSPTASSAARS